MSTCRKHAPGPGAAVLYRLLRVQEADLSSENGSEWVRWPFEAPRFVPSWFLQHVGWCTAGARDSDPHDPGIRHAGRSRLLRSRLLGTFGGIFGSAGGRGRGGGRIRRFNERRRKGGEGERVLWRQGFRTWRQAARTVRSLDASPCDSRFYAVHLDRVDLGSVRGVKRCDQHAGTAEEVGPVRLAYLATHVEERHPHVGVGGLEPEPSARMAGVFVECVAGRQHDEEQEE
mmetsp:Transcript_21222/g.54025  ORF Transcript_21222/g.54025 Transcript_21222/m.54025 type:complete len:230 (+) Transcript_21222:204-893(+)